MPARGPGPQPVLRFALPSSASIVPRGAALVATPLLFPHKDASSAGRMTALHLRALDRLDDATAIRGTENAREQLLPDGQWIGFQHEGQLKRIPLGGGALISLATSQTRGASVGTPTG